eukprot:5123205-Prymnesium_polylepis.1
MTVQSALLRAHRHPTDHGLATRPIHEIDLTECGLVGSRMQTRRLTRTPARPARAPTALLAPYGAAMRIGAR